jgi:hypothetical protein
MGISTGAGGIIVETFAKDSRLTESTLGSQSGAGDDEVIVPNAIGTNNEGDLESSPSYVGRLIIIRPECKGVSGYRIENAGSSYVVSDVVTLSGGTKGNAATLTVTSVDSGAVTGLSITTAGDYTVTPSDPVSTTGGTGTGLTLSIEWYRNDETRYITADASNTLTVHEDWIQNPASGEDWALFYIIEDVETKTGCTFVSKSRLYTFSRILIIGVTPTPANAGLALLDGAALELRSTDGRAVPLRDQYFYRRRGGPARDRRDIQVLRRSDPVRDLIPAGTPRLRELHDLVPPGPPVVRGQHQVVLQLVQLLAPRHLQEPDHRRYRLVE